MARYASIINSIQFNRPDSGFTIVTRKRKDLKLKLLTRMFPAAEQKVILQLESKLTITITECLTLANEAL